MTLLVPLCFSKLSQNEEAIVPQKRMNNANSDKFLVHVLAKLLENAAFRESELLLDRSIFHQGFNAANRVAK